MTTTECGSRAETFVAQRLIQSGYVIVAQNWRTKWCEIDIIAKKHMAVYFVEVRYRTNDHYGDGLASITPAKYRQMRLAAQIWLSQHSAGEVRLCVASVDARSNVQWVALD